MSFDSQQSFRGYGTTGQKQILHNPTERHKEGAPHLPASERANNESQRTTVDKSTFQNVNVITEERANVFPPDKLFALAGGKKRALSCRDVLLKGNQPIESFKGKKYPQVYVCFDSNFIFRSSD